MKKSKLFIVLFLLSVVIINIIDISYIESTTNIILNDIDFRIDTKIEINEDKIYLLLDNEYGLSYTGNHIIWGSSNDEIVSVSDGIIKGINPGKATITATNAASSVDIEVEVTDLITNPTLNNNKELLPCNKYTEEENKLLDLLLENEVNKAGYQTRAGAVAAARFLSLQFKYRLAYFYENGRLYTEGGRAYADGEGRYYHKGLYLSESKKNDLNASVHGPSIWGCPLYSGVIKKTTPNGLDCSGYVTWSLLNAGFDIGDIGAGITSAYDLSDIGKKVIINEENINNKNFKVGDLLSRSGHIGILIGYDEETFYIAEELDHDLHVLTMNKKDLLSSKWKYFINLDDVYKVDGNLNNMW